MGIQSFKQLTTYTYFTPQQEKIQYHFIIQGEVYRFDVNPAVGQIEWNN